LQEKARKDGTLIDARKVALLTNVYIIIHKVRANASGNYIHKENKLFR
jgi:hypothetical protein